MEENCRGEEADDGFATWNEAVASVRGIAVWRRQANGPILPEETQGKR